MSWRRPPTIAPRQLKRSGQQSACADAATAAGEAAVAAGRAAEAAGAAASAASAVDRLSKPKHRVEAKTRRNPKEIREAALAKMRAMQQSKAGGGTPAGGTPRVRTTVTKKKKTAGGGEETTTVEKVQSGAAALPRYNRKKVMHPEDVYKERRMAPPTKPPKPCPKIKKGEFYEKDVVALWEQWQKWNDYNEEIKCWKLNVPFMSQKEKEDRRFERWLQKEEETHERLYKAGKSDVMPFHLRPDPEAVAAAAKKKKTPGTAQKKSPSKRPLPKTPTGKKRWEEKDCFGNFIRYNSVGDPHPEDLYRSSGSQPPPYVQPPLREDGTFKLPKQRTAEESEAFTQYRKWEEFYFRQQAWDNDKKWEGDPRIRELFKIKYPSRDGPSGATPGQRTAEERAAERAGRKGTAEQRRKELKAKAEREAQACARKMGLKGKMTGAAKAALQSLARKEAAARAEEEAKANALLQRQKSFLKRGSRGSPVLGKGKIDVSRVGSRIGAQRRAAAEAAAAAAAAAEAAAQAQALAPPPLEVAEVVEGPPPPGMPYETYDERLQNAARQRRAKAYCDRMTGQIVRHLNLSGQMGHTPTTVHMYDVGERPRPVRGSDVAILQYDPSTPTRSLFGGPGPDDDDEELGCDMPSAGWFEPDEPISPFGRTFTRMRHPSPPRSISKGRLPHQPMHPHDAMRMQYEMTDDEYWFTDQELESPDSRAYRDVCAEAVMNRPLRERASRMEAQTDPTLLHPTVFRSNLQERQDQIASRQQILSNLGAVSQMIQAGALPEVRPTRVTRAWQIASPPSPPRPRTPPRVAELVSIDSSICPTPTTPSPVVSPQPRARMVASPFELPARFAGGPNPFLERARAAIADPVACITSRAQEIAEQAARTAAAAQPRRAQDIFGAWDAQDFEWDMREQACIDQALEEMPSSEPCTPEGYRWPDYRQVEGPQYGALYHEHIRQPQLGPWHCTPPGGRQAGYAD